jgi:hypothetical protein
MEFTLPGRPLSRSYGAILPSSLTRVISITLVFSTCPPVSVLVRARASCLEDFLGGMASGTRRPSGQLASHLTVTGFRICLEALATCLPPHNRRRGSLSLPRPPIGQMIPTWYRNINLLSIDYAFRPRLRSRLTLSRRTLLRNPWAIGGGDSHPSFVTHAGILTSHASTAGLRRRFTGEGTLSYRASCDAPAASEASLSPVTLSAPEHLTSELLRTLSRMAASKPTSWLSVHSDIVCHLACI